MTIDEVLTRSVDKILPSKKGLKALITKKKIRLYLGIDPTATRLHLGHTIMIRKLAAFSELGHQAILLFGTGTTLVGDPSQRAESRKLITYQKIKQNMASWKNQISPILDLKKVQIVENGQWLTKLKLTDLIKIASHISAVQLFKRQSFQQRIKKGGTVWYHETMYPLLQGYDSVHLNVDLEIGGTDQEFNMLMGRELQQKINQKEKFVLMGKMILGTDGQKMSKTSKNCIWLTDKPQDMYGKIMSLKDQLIPDYFEFFTNLPMAEIKALRKNLQDPLTQKKKLALMITTDFHGQAKALKAQQYFETTFQKKAPQFKKTIQNQKTLLKTIAQITSSNSEAKRLITQKGVAVNQKTVTDFNHPIQKGDKIKVGKKNFVSVL